MVDLSIYADVRHLTSPAICSKPTTKSHKSHIVTIMVFYLLAKVMEIIFN